MKISEGDNLSDHFPIILELNIPCSHLPHGTRDDVRFNGNRPAWHRANDPERRLYKVALRESLSEIRLPHNAIACRNFECAEHSEEIGRYHDQLIDACIKAAQATIPVVRRVTKKAGWSEIVAPFQKEAIFWNRIWVECGKPESGWVFEIRNKTRKEYKSRSRWVVRNQDKLKSGKMAACILENRSRDFWSEVKK